MNEIILAYGLGIVSVGLVLLTRVVLKADKKVNEHERWVDNLQREQERNLGDVYRRLDEERRQSAYEFEDVHRKIDSRIDKLEFKMKDQLNYVKDKTSQAY